MKLFFKITMLLTTLIIMNNCKSAAPNENPVPHDFLISFGSGGGFTGMWHGYLIDSTDSIFKWEGRFQEQKITRHVEEKEDVKVSTELKKDIFDRVKLLRLIEIQKEEPSNMTNYIRIRYNSKENVILWNPFAKDELSVKLSEFLRFLQDSMIKK